MSYLTQFTQKDRIIKAKVDLNSTHPFFAYILMNMCIKESAEDKKLPTMGINQYGDLSWNGDFTKTLSDSHLNGVLAHEAMHMATLTFPRKGDRDHMLWNIATDLVINTLLIADGFDLPKDCILPDKKDCWEFKGKGGKMYKLTDVSKRTAEDVYDFIITHVEEIKNGWGNGDGQGGYSGSFDTHEPGDGKDSSADEKANSEKWKKIVTEAATNAKSRGQGGSIYERIVGKLLEPELDWRAILAQFMTKNMPVDYTMRMPGRRFHTTGVYYPSIIRESLEIVVCIDVSGSISGDEYNKFISEITGIAGAFPQINMRMLWWSTKVTDDLEVTKGNMDELVSYKFHSTGGTTMSCVKEYIDKKNINSQIYVYFTDGCIEDNPKIPDGQKLFVTAGSYSNDDIIKKYGTVCKLKL